MGWFKKTDRKKRQAVVESPKEELWAVCSSCEAHIYREEWEKNLNVCPKCNFHDKINWNRRLELLVDEDSFQEFDSDIGASDPLEFADASGTYKAKAQAVGDETGLNESIVTGRAFINAMRVVIGVMDFRFLGGSLGSGTGQKIFLAADYALRHRLPLILVCASGGARMQEGVVSLMQMAKTSAAIARLHENRVPYISILTHPTTGGVSASYAMLGDVNIAEPGVLIGFAGRRVIEQTIKQQLPKEFQTAEYLLEHGFVDMIVQRGEMKDMVHRLLRYWIR